ncbi:hypothetical protein [Stygiobacter electus]|uniref:Uncharacterized protein n=1 Tax=Stygiobacter electus TaxID=3032292 RepID=A0AAE3TCP7_9BACT|nr:hypothetical protein [Stygiobacter electus]MDF1612643.1 hypothetical protein [Stygiobacter electus]
MQTFEYSIISKFFYRYINIIITIFLLLFTIVSLYVSFQKWYFIFLVIFNLVVIVLLNRSYFYSYKTLPFKITSDEEKIICSKFFMSKKEVVIFYKDINSISGGIFSGMPMRAVYLTDSKGNLISFYSHVGKFNELLKTILRNVTDEVYNLQLEKLKKISSLN